MKTQVDKSQIRGKSSPSSLRKIEMAKKDYANIWKEVEPFVRKKTINPYSTVGTWLSLNYESSE